LHKQGSKRVPKRDKKKSPNRDSGLAQTTELSTSAAATSAIIAALGFGTDRNIPFFVSLGYIIWSKRVPKRDQKKGPKSDSGLAKSTDLSQLAAATSAIIAALGFGTDRNTLGASQNYVLRKVKPETYA